MGTEGHFSCTDSTLISSSSVCKSAAYCTDSQLMCTWEEMLTGGDGRINSPHQYSISRQFAPLPPFFPRRLGCRRHPCAFSPKGSLTLRADRTTRRHVRAWHVVGQPPR